MQADWPTENIVLALLCEQPMHGYELAKTVKNDLGLRAIWRIERSEVYFLLGKLLKQGFITETEQAGGEGTRPARVIYAPTAAGEAALEEWLTSPEKYPRNLRTAMLARVYLALRREPALAMRLIEAQKALLLNWLEFERQRVHENEVVAMVRRFRAAQVEATIAALDDLRRMAASRTGLK